jgi:hypothetical protein
MESIVHHLGLALGGRLAAGFAKRLMLPVSKDTLLRVETGAALYRPLVQNLESEMARIGLPSNDQNSDHAAVVGRVITI